MVEMNFHLLNIYTSQFQSYITKQHFSISDVIKQIPEFKLLPQSILQLKCCILKKKELELVNEFINGFS